MRHLIVTLFVLLSWTALAAPVQAQHARAAAFRAAAAAPERMRVGLPSSKKAHIITGAVVASLTAIAIIAAYEHNTHDDSLVPPILYAAPVVVVSAGVGAGIGYVVWRIRR